jgi:hypothetical protein
MREGSPTLRFGSVTRSHKPPEKQVGWAVTQCPRMLSILSWGGKDNRGQGPDPCPNVRLATCDSAHLSLFIVLVCAGGQPKLHL